MQKKEEKTLKMRLKMCFVVMHKAKQQEKIIIRQLLVSHYEKNNPAELYSTVEHEKNAAFALTIF